MTTRNKGYALLATLIALIASQWDRVVYEWGESTETQKWVVITVASIVAAWALWPLAAILAKAAF